VDTTTAAGRFTVTHDLGYAPDVVLCQVGGAGYGGAKDICFVDTIGASTFSGICYTASTGAVVATTSKRFSWIAMGAT